MMIEPPLTEIMKKVDSRYTLVIAVAKRARQLKEGAPKLTSCSSPKPVSIAAQEIYDDKITYERHSEE